MLMRKDLGYIRKEKKMKKMRKIGYESIIVNLRNSEMFFDDVDQFPSAPRMARSIELRNVWERDQ